MQGAPWQSEDQKLVILSVSSKKYIIYSAYRRWEDNDETTQKG